MFASILNWLYVQIGDYTATVIIAVITVNLFIFPFHILRQKTVKKKKLIAPEIKEIREKYHAEKFGVNLKNDDTLSEEIRNLSEEDRILKLDEEINAVYKREKYKPFFSWIPTALILITAILLYSSITAAIPLDFYRETLWNIKYDLIGHADAALLLIPSLIWSLSSSWHGIVEAITKTNENKVNRIVSLISNVLSCVLAIYINMTISAAIAVAFTTYQIINQIIAIIVKVLVK